MEEKTQQVVITRTLPAGIERVWKAFTVPEDILKWQSPVGMTALVQPKRDVRKVFDFSISVEKKSAQQKVP